MTESIGWRQARDMSSTQRRKELESRLTLLWNKRFEPEQPTQLDVAELKDQFESIDMQNHSLRTTLQKIMAKLADLLDEDQYAHIESLVLKVGVEPPTPAPDVAELLETLNLIANCEASDLALAYCKGIAAAALAKHGGGICQN